VEESTSQKPKVVGEMAPAPKTQIGFVLEDRIAEIIAQRDSKMAEGISPPPKTTYQIAFNRQIADAVMQKDKEAEDHLTGPRSKSQIKHQARFMKPNATQQASEGPENIQGEQGHRMGGDDEPISQTQSNLDAASGRASGVSPTNSGVC